MIEWLRSYVEPDVDLPPDLAPATDLLEQAIIDSMGFLELIAFVEDTVGRRIDLMDVDPDDLTSVSGLCRHIAKTVGQDER